MPLDKPPPMPRPSPGDLPDDLAVFVACGEALYGPHWQSPLATLCGVSRSHMSAIVSRAKALSPKTKRKLRASLIHLQPQIQEDARWRIRVVAEAIARFPDDV